MLLGEDAVGLLLTTGSDKSVNLLDLDVVELVDSLLDSRLGGTAVNDENKGVVVFNGLDSGFSSAGELDNGVFVPGVLLHDGVAFDLGGTELGESSLKTEGGLGPYLVLANLVGTFLDLLLDSLSLNLLGTRGHTQC